MTDLEHIDGLYVGQLNLAELLLFERAVDLDLAYRSYEGAPGFLGLAKVWLIPSREIPLSCFSPR